MNILVTGGAGFIGTSLVRRLLKEGSAVTILDNFSPQIHGESAELDPQFADDVRLIRADVRDQNVWAEALVGQDVVVHLAAETGTGQSMYRVRHYSEVNITGTAALMEQLLTKKYPVKSVIVASSRSVYGEGAYSCGEHGTVYPRGRSLEDMKAGDFEVKCPVCGHSALMIPTPEDALVHPISFYAITKHVQEQTVLMYAAALGINGFGLRYQNVYGPGQSLKNPYTGILAIFSNQARVNAPIYIFEDGNESRDFVYIDDVVEATVRCIHADAQVPSVLNVGTGVAVTVSDVVENVLRYFGSSSKVFVTGAFRQGDIRHNCADVQQLRKTLGFVPSMRFEDGITRFLFWAEAQELQHGSSYERSLAEMRQLGLMHG